MPRRILLMVPAGKPVDETLAALAPHLEAGDTVIDGGNEHYAETEARQAHWRKRGVHLIGMGVSGGEEGARHGPSLMPGGDEGAYREVEPILREVAAKVEDGPCVTYVGPRGAGHFVKMVHNGIEYADMQLIAEIYDLLKHVGGLDDDALAETFSLWNEGELESFLVEITARIFQVSDEGGGRRVNAVLDTAKMKGTGSWTVKAGAEIAAPIPTIASAVEARLMSGLHPLRQVAAKTLAGPEPQVAEAREGLVEDARAALYAAKIAAYAQGLDLLARASGEHDWNLDLVEIARIWKGGCIIRARLLRWIQSAYRNHPELENLMLDPALASELENRQARWRRTVARCIDHGIAAPAMMSALAYYDGLRRARLPANLTQAQRDLFGAHGYQRVDGGGETLHSEW
jgi:6-phosphogluconate dehydrogenase